MEQKLLLLLNTHPYAVAVIALALGIAYEEGAPGLIVIPVLGILWLAGAITLTHALLLYIIFFLVMSRRESIVERDRKAINEARKSRLEMLP